MEWSKRLIVSTVTRRQLERTNLVLYHVRWVLQSHLARSAWNCSEALGQLQQRRHPQGPYFGAPSIPTSHPLFQLDQG